MDIQWISGIIDLIRAGWQAWSSWRRKKILLRIIELRKEAVNIQNQYSIPQISTGGLIELITSVRLWKRDFLVEIGKISKLKSVEYETLGDADRKPFEYLWKINPQMDLDHLLYLAIIRTYRLRADEFLNENKKYL